MAVLNIARSGEPEAAKATDKLTQLLNLGRQNTQYNSQCSGASRGPMTAVAHGGRHVSALRAVAREPARCTRVERTKARISDRS
jgi:hypothetical protein